MTTEKASKTMSNKDYHQKWRDEKRERVRGYHRKYREAHKERANAAALKYGRSEKGKENYRRSYYMRAYGITIDQYDMMKEKQNGVCAICGTDRNYGNRRLYVDHCHKTGKVRGLLCYRCNSGLASFNDDTKTVGKAFKYITNAEGGK